MSTYQIPLFDLNFDDSEEKAVVKTLQSKWISMGQTTVEFEKKFAESLNVGHAIALSNCTVSLHMALVLLGIGKGDEVICPSLTFVATANAIRYVNAKAVFCDVHSLEDLTLDTSLLESLITNKTKAILPMHYAGFPCNMDEIVRIARKHKLHIIEDTSHAPLSEYKNKKLGTIGDIGCFSFFANKNISTGEGGMLVTNNDKYADKARLLRSHGMTSLSFERSKGHSTNYDVVELGFNYRIDDIRSSIGIVQLEKLKKDIEKRAKIRDYYIDKLKDIKGICLPFITHKGIVTNYVMPLILENSDHIRRENVRNFMKEKGIQTSVHYPSVHKFSIYTQDQIYLPITEYVSDNEITIPMYSKLSVQEIDYIVETIKKAI